MIDDYPIPAIQTLHNGKVFTATDLEMKGLTEEEITLLKELDRKENEGKN